MRRTLAGHGAGADGAPQVRRRARQNRRGGEPATPAMRPGGAPGVGLGANPGDAPPPAQRPSRRWRALPRHSAAARRRSTAARRSMPAGPTTSMPSPSSTPRWRRWPAAPPAADRTARWPRAPLPQRAAHARTSTCNAGATMAVPGPGIPAARARLRAEPLPRSRRSGAPGRCRLLRRTTPTSASAVRNERLPALDRAACPGCQRVHDLRPVRPPEEPGRQGPGLAALVSWGIALFEYLLQVPGNRIGCRRHRWRS